MQTIKSKKGSTFMHIGITELYLQTLTATHLPHYSNPIHTIGLLQIDNVPVSLLLIEISVKICSIQSANGIASTMHPCYQLWHRSSRPQVWMAAELGYTRSATLGPPQRHQQDRIRDFLLLAIQTHYVASIEQFRCSSQSPARISQIFAAPFFTD